MTILMLLASLNSCTNPWIYVAFSLSMWRKALPCFSPDRPRGHRTADGQRHRLHTTNADDTRKTSATNNSYLTTVTSRTELTQYDATHNHVPLLDKTIC